LKAVESAVETRVESARFQRLKLKLDEAPSIFAFNSNLRRYTLAWLGN
jgi:hypothetical protein